MPFVRYARDRRGYETLYVMHAFETGRDGRSRPRVLYACRSVPYARVGRAPLDESVQRRIQTAYPSLEFDWPRLLKEAAASAPRPEKHDKRDEPRKGRGRDRERKPRKEPARAPQPPPERTPAAAEAPAPPAPEAAPAAVASPDVTPAPEPAPSPASGPPPEPVAQAESGSGPELLHEPEPIIGELRVDPAWPAVALAGQTRVLVLRGRYIEIANRVMSRVDDVAERRRLLREAARLNPESWRTADEARAGVEGFDAAYDALAARLRQTPAV